MKVEIPDSIRQSSRQRVMAGAEELLAARRASAPAPLQLKRRRPLLWRPIALAAALMLPLTAGTAVAASQANPDSILYPVKQGMESAREKIALDSAARAGIEIDHAGNRLDEAVEMIEGGKLAYVPDLLARFQLHMDSARGHLEEARAAGEDVSGIEAKAGTAMERYDGVLQMLNEGSGADAPATLVASSPGSTSGKKNEAYSTGAGHPLELAALYAAADPRGVSLAHEPLPDVAAADPEYDDHDDAEDEGGWQTPGDENDDTGGADSVTPHRGKANSEDMNTAPGKEWKEKTDAKNPADPDSRKPAAAAPKHSPAAAGHGVSGSDWQKSEPPAAESA